MTIKEIFEYKITITDDFIISINSLLIVLIIIIVTKIVIWLFKRIFRKQETKGNFGVGKSHALFQILKYTLWIISFSLILETVGFKITILLAGSAALLVGLGLGLQEIFKDIVSGVFILFEGHIKVGDILELDGMVGAVREVGLRTSKLETRDNIIVIVPNSKFITGNVINWSHIDTKTRFSVKVGVAYSSDARNVENILIGCAKNNKLVSKNPEPFVQFKDFGESSLDFELFFFTNDSFRVENIKSQLRFDIKEAFIKNNIEIPFPQRVIHSAKS